MCGSQKCSIECGPEMREPLKEQCVPFMKVLPLCWKPEDQLLCVFICLFQMSPPLLGRSRNILNNKEHVQRMALLILKSPVLQFSYRCHPVISVALMPIHAITFL